MCISKCGSIKICSFYLIGDEIQLDIQICPNTECCRVGSRSFVMTIDNESLFLRFSNDEG